MSVGFSIHNDRVSHRVVVIAASRHIDAATEAARALAIRFGMDIGVVECNEGAPPAAHSPTDSNWAGPALAAAEAMVLWGTRSLGAPRTNQVLDEAERRHVPIVVMADDARASLEPVGVVVLPISASIDQLAGVLRGVIARGAEVDRLRALHSDAQQSSGGLRQAIGVIEDELQLAASVQREFIPATLPTLGPISVAALWRPASFVSGDIYNAIRLDEHHLGLFCADAVGHGVPAALLTLVISRSLPTKQVTGDSYRLIPPAEALERVNTDLLMRSGRSTRFATAVYAVIDTRNGQMQISSGGHPPAIRMRPDGSMDFFEVKGGLLGVFDGETFSGASATLDPGDWLLIYTDGFEQSLPSPGHVHGNLRMPNRRYLDMFASLAGFRDPRTFVDAVARRIDAEADDEPLPDDVTLLCARVGE